MGTKEKRNTGLVVVIILLIVALLGSVGYTVYDKVLSKNTATKESESKGVKETKVNTEAMDVNSVKADLMDRFLVYGDNLLFYKQDKLLAKDISNKRKINMAFINVQKDVNNKFITDENTGIATTDVKILEDEIKRLFGLNIKYTLESNTEDDEICPKLTFNQNTLSYYGGCGDSPTQYPMTIPSSAIKYDDRIEYTEVVYFVDEMNGKVYSDLFKTIVFEYNNAIQIKELALENLDKLPKYKFTFNLDTNGNYYFYSVEKIK